jgi:NAD(P)-dependent dehydrogenase (short-subunit alcohol dehydrogenase family)
VHDTPTPHSAGPVPWDRPSSRLRGRVAMVTGAALGIGRAVARRFAREGATVFAADRLPDELGAVVAALTAEGVDVRACPLDVTDDAAVAAAIADIVHVAGRIDVLANVAGIIALEAIDATDVATFDRIVAVNLRGPFLTMRAVAPHMRRAGRGAIINVSSRAGTVGSALEAAYCASKFGLEGLSRAAAKDLQGDGISVNTITPGVPTRTAMSETTYGPEQRTQWRDPDVITPAFVQLALQDPTGIHDQHVNAWQLSERLRRAVAP